VGVGYPPAPAGPARECAEPVRTVTVRLFLVLGLLLFAAPAAQAQARQRNLPLVGFGEQRADVFTNPFWQDLDLQPMRYVVGWDALRYRWQRGETDAWMNAATAAGARPLIALTRSRAHWRTKVVPSVGTWLKAFKAFRARYPQVTDYLVWNEANHCSQPVCHKPERVAAYYDAAVKACPRCRIIGADVLDTPSLAWYVRRFKHAVRHRPRIWGLHNYVDANNLTTTGTRLLLRMTRGHVWFTETGGLVKRNTTSPIKFPQSVAHAAKATRFVLDRLAGLSPRIKRIYLYHFEWQGPTAAWDSGVISPHGKPRPAYRVVARWAVRAAKARARRNR
jgi:hypothetical protein